MRFKTRGYRTLPRTSDDETLIGELTLRPNADVGVPTFTLSDEECRGHYHLIYSGNHYVCLHNTPLTLNVKLTRSCGFPAPTGSYLVDTLPNPVVVSSRQYFVSNGEQELPFIGCGILHPGDFLVVSSSPLVEIPFDSAWSSTELKSDDQNVVGSNFKGLV